MALNWIGVLDKGAILDEAQQLAMRHLAAAFAEVRESYKKVNFDVGAKCTRLQELVIAGRAALAEQQSSQNRYELESKERRDVVEKAKVWFTQLHTAGRYAKAIKHPLGERLPKLMFTGETDLESWRASLESLNKALANLAREPVDWASLGLPPDFLDQGRAILASMTSEWSDAIDAESNRFFHTERLAAYIDEIVDIFEEIHAARDMAMVMTGKELPGLELSLVKAAAGAPRTGNEAPPDAAPPATGL